MPYGYLDPQKVLKAGKSVAFLKGSPTK